MNAEMSFADWVATVPESIRRDGLWKFDAFGKDYARFLRIALGSARETRGWYWKSRHALNETIVAARIHLLDEIIAALVTASNHQRNLSP